MLRPFLLEIAGEFGVFRKTTLGGEYGCSQEGRC